MFTCGTKKKSTQVPVILEDKCKEHNQPFDFVSLTLTNKNLTVKGCAQCKISRSKEEFISVKDIKAKLLQQSAADIAGEYKLKLTPLLNETEQQRKKLISLADEIYENIMQGIQDLFVHSIIKQLPNQLFTFFDVFDLIQPKTIEDFIGIVDQQIQINKVDETSLGLFAKVICKEKEAQQFLEALPKENDGIKKKLEKIHVDFAEMNNLVKRTVEQTKKQNTIQIPKLDLKDSALQFMSQQQENHAQNIQAMKGQRGKQIKPVDSEKSENPLIKQIIEMEDNYIAYSTGTKIMIFDQTKDFQYLQQIDCENDVTAICALKLDQKSYLISSVEEAEDVFQLIFWDWKNFEKDKVLIAHEKYIWNIINLPQFWIATCSEDMTIKVFDGTNQKEMTTIAVHQASVNDIALVNQEVIVSVSDDGMVAASNFKTGDFKGMAVEDCEIKCVVALDGIKFATGNSNGEVRIYLCTQQIELQTTIKLHEAVVRFMSRVDSKSFVTSSWDGTHWFISANGEKLKQIAEGPRKNFSEPVLWAGHSLLGSSGGYLYLYQ